MPRLNGTGPQGAGSQTGRSMGNCSTEKSTAPYLGRGHRMGNGQGKGNRCGRGYGFKKCFQSQELTPEEQQEMLSQEKSFLESQLSSINKELENL